MEDIVTQEDTFLRYKGFRFDRANTETVPHTYSYSYTGREGVSASRVMKHCSYDLDHQWLDLI